MVVTRILATDNAARRFATITRVRCFVSLLKLNPYEPFPSCGVPILFFCREMVG